MKAIYDLYCEMIEEKGNEDLDQHWCMVFADKIQKQEIEFLESCIRNTNSVRKKLKSRIKYLKGEKEVEPIILDDNELSIAAYAKEYPENFEKICKSIKGKHPAVKKGKEAIKRLRRRNT